MKIEDAIEQAYRNGFEAGRRSPVWTTAQGYHINTAHVRTFCWKNGQLCIWYAGQHFYIEYDDPNKELYKEMCSIVGVNPAQILEGSE